MQKLDSGGQGQIYAYNADTIFKLMKFSDHYKEISELCVLKGLSHPCIVKAKKWELSRNECKIYMERLYNNIFDYSKKVDFKKRLELFPQIFWNMVRVARFFQVNGIMNCDIKSENVMISKDGKTVKIIDFGHLICDENHPIVGTRSYQPPELWLLDKFTDKSMVWAIGITALEFLYRVHPIVDMVYGEETNSSRSFSSSDKDKKGKKAKEKSPELSGVSSEETYSSEDDDEYDEYRNRYTTLFEILMERGQTLPFRHRLDQNITKEMRDKLSTINSILDRMLTYDLNKRISLEELYKHRIFDKIRGNVKEEQVMTHIRDPLYMDKELTPLFLHTARKLYREEIIVQSYTLLSMYLDKYRIQGKKDFIIVSLACLDIMSYVFSMVSSSRAFDRKVFLKIKGIYEDEIFDRAVEILKALEFKVFLQTPIDAIKGRQEEPLYPLLLEIIENEAEQGKKKYTSKALFQRYMSEEFLSLKEMDFSDEESETSDESDSDLFDEKDEKSSDSKKSRRSESSKSDYVLDDDDIEEDFLEDFKKRVLDVCEKDKKNKEEHPESDELVVYL
jgi:serine/threonine protein kinase